MLYERAGFYKKKIRLKLAKKVLCYNPSQKSYIKFFNFGD